MPRTYYRPLAALALVVVVLTYVGCNSGTPTPTKGTSPTAGSSASSNSAKLFADWPKPAGTLLISGEQDGYLEPCGCAMGQLGGLRRRFDLIERTRQQGWPMAMIDLGGLIKDPALARGGPEQEKATFEVALKALGLMKYDALALSAEDLKVGVDEVLGQFLNMGEHPKVLAANVTAAQGFENTVRRSLKMASGPVKIGVTAVIDPESLNKLADPAKDLLLPSITPPEQGLGEILADLEKDTQTQVLMVQGSTDLAKSLAGKFPGFDIVVATSILDASEDAESLNGGKTFLVSVGKKGQYVGVIGLYPDGSPKYRYQRIALNDKYNGDAEPMRKLIEDDFQEMLKQRAVVETFPRRDFVGGAPGATFVGAETCKSCHPKTFEKWAASKHAHAFEDIVKDPKGRRSDHQFDAECVSCHTTGFEYNSGWISAEKTANLKGNQCENCHGPASKHVAEPTNPEFRRAIARKADEVNKTGFCIRCHDMDNSPHFKFEVYWEKIAHKHLDSYPDAKVKGAAAKVTQGAK